MMTLAVVLGLVLVLGGAIVLVFGRGSPTGNAVRSAPDPNAAARTGPMRIECGPCALRPWQPGDETALVRHANDRRIWEGLRDRFPHPYTRRDAEGWIAFAGGQQPTLNFAIVVGDDPVGGIGIERQDHVHRHAAELGYWLGAAAWGRGIATAAVRGMTSHAFDTLGIGKLFATPFSSNPASARVLEKLGYRHEGRLRGHVIKDGRNLDLDIYGILREEWTGTITGS